MNDLLRHIRACNNAVLPGGRLPLRLGPDVVGWVRPGLASVLRRLDAVVGEAALVVPGRMPTVARGLADAGLCRWRGEAFDVRAVPDGPVLDTVDRGALPLLGVQAEGVHMNGLVRRGDDWWVWVARRAADKLLDPGKLDHLVAGGVPAGLTPAETLVKEGAEEAGLPPELCAAARHRGTISYAMERPEGLRRDRLHVYDLVLPDGFTPEPRDGEVAGFELWRAGDVLERVRRTADFKFNVNLVLIGLFRRLGMLDEGEMASTAELE